MFTTRVCADCVLVAQVDEQPVRVGVLLQKAVELFHALGGLLAAQAHAVEELSHPPLAGTHVESLPSCRAVLLVAPSVSSGGERVVRVEHPGAQPPDLSQAKLRVPSPLCLPLVQNVSSTGPYVEEPVAHDGVDVDFVALRTAAAGLVFNERSGWSGRGGTGIADVGDLLVCERLGDGVSAGRHQPG